MMKKYKKDVECPKCGHKTLNVDLKKDVLKRPVGYKCAYDEYIKCPKCTADIVIRRVK